MLDLPKSTEFQKRIPKQKFYEHTPAPLPTALKNAFVTQIKDIIWRNKIAPVSVLIRQGEKVKEIEVFTVHLTAPALDEAVLRQIDEEIPHPILFLLEFEGKIQAWAAYKAESGKITYFHTAWLQEPDLPLKMEGTDTDTVYENFIRQIAGDTLPPVRSEKETLAQTIARAEQRAALQKEISTLQNKIRREKQFNKQVEMNAQLYKLRKSLEVL